MDVDGSVVGVVVLGATVDDGDGVLTTSTVRGDAAPSDDEQAFSTVHAAKAGHQCVGLTTG